MTFDEGCVKEFEFTRVKQNGNILKCKMIKSKPSDGGCGDDHVYIWSSSDGWKNDLTMVGKYVKTPGRGGTNTMEFFNTDVYIDGVTGKQTISSKSVDYSHTTAGSYDVLSFNNVEIYKGSWDVPLGISFVSGSGTSDDPYITEWTKSRENGTILSSIHSGDQINGVEVLEKTDSTIKFSSNQDKRFRKDNSGICHVLNEAMTFDELSSDTAIYTFSKSNSNSYPKNAKIFYCYFDPGSGVQHYPSGIKTIGWNETNSSIRSCIDKVNSWGTSINFCDPGVRNTPSLYGYCGWCASWCTSQCEESFCRHINNAGPYEITTYENEVEGETEKGKIVKADFSGNESRGAESMVLYEFKYECQFQKISDSIIYGSSFCKAGFYINNNVNNSLTKALIKCINNDGIICSVYTPKENDIFINQENQRLIQCYKDIEKNNEGCISYVKNSWNDDIPEYFINAGSETNDFSDNIIKCTSEKCEINSSTVDSTVFLNGNLKDEENSNSKSTDDSQLIICKENPNENKKKCYTEKVEIESEGFIYYRNAGNYTENQVKVEKSYIKCTNIMENVYCTISTTKEQPKNEKNFYCYFDPGSGVQHYPSGIKTIGWNETNSSIRSCIDKVNSWGTSINFCDPGVRNTPSLYGYCGW
eukprot:jgi/Orpsp1_1/1181869/evm.model.c7180000078931.1